MQTRFKRHHLAIAATLAAASYLPSGWVMAGVGAGDSFDTQGNPLCVPSFFVSSPSGPRRTTSACSTDLATQLGVGPSTGTALRKFVDTLPQVGREIPKAVSEAWTRPDGTKADGLDGKVKQEYYELAVIEYTQRQHTDLKRETLLRGYVQLASKAWQAANPGQGVPLFYPGARDALTGKFAPGAPILIQDTDAKGFLRVDANGVPIKVQAIAVAAAQELGPVIFATKDIPVRVKFINLLPAGRANATLNADGSWTVNARNGDMFLPTDKSIAGAGVGPDGLTEYTQNRVNIHLHGGDTPWISDGTPHQWITPVEEANKANPLSLAAAATGAAPTLDPSFLPEFLRGASTANVPDMPDPGAGAMTYYFPNGQTARQMWYHDHTIGATRLNVYSGIVSGYFLTDPVEQALINGGTVNGTALAKVLPAEIDTIPLILQNRTFVPADIKLQDGRWHTEAWGGESDLWFPHVYETVQDPNQDTGFNAVGRWHYGPQFFPIFPALYALPSGSYNDVTTTPEAWMDTSVVNGKAYPTLDVDPKTYRLRVLNASNDRTMTFNLFVADDKNPAPFIDPATGAPSLTEVSMVPAVIPAVTCAPGVTRYSQAFDAAGKPMVDAAGAPVMCTPDTWQMDARNGGVPNPATQGPTLYQIGTEGGFLPKVAAYDPAPMAYLLDKGRINVLNVDTASLFIAPAERADLVVDFSQYAGKTLIVYNDTTAAVPAGDPRNEYFTGVGDQSATGGAEDTLAGYGPNTRTMMRIRVRATAPAAPLNVAALATEIPKAYGASQERPIVAQSAYNQALGTNYTDAQAYARIYTGTLKEPQFVFTPGTPGVFNSVAVSSAGTGYTSAPTVAFSGGGGTGAAAVATLKLDKLTVLTAGSGYTIAPVVTISTPVAGGGASASATLKVASVNILSGGAGYAGTSAAVTFSKPQTVGGVTATGTATISNGKVTAINITNAGSGYTAVPTITVTGGTTKAQLQVSGAVGALTLTSPDPTAPLTAGGGGYTNLTPTTGLVITIGAPQIAGGVTATASATGKVFDVTLSNVGSGYTSAPTVSISGGGGSGAVAAVDTANGGAATGRILVKSKAIQELFDPTFGRLNATLGVELPFTSALTQTTIPLGNIDTPTEEFGDGETQIWKITHNGVDTHPVHFHLLNVQLINRVGWDGYIMPPLPNEIGWKETIKMNPLEDVIVAVRAKRPKLPGFGVANSVRAMDPSQPLGSPFGFTQVDPVSGNPKSVVNDLYNYNWEYVWHCHILGHEENDFMRPIVFKGNEVAPLAPTGLTYTSGLLSWVDNDTGVGTSRSAEVGFRAETRIGSAAFAPVVPTQSIKTGLNATQQITTREVNTLANATSIAVPAITSITTTNPVVTLGAVTSSSVSLSWTTVANATGYRVLRNNVQIATLANSVLTYTDSTAQPSSTYTYSVVATAPTNVDYRLSSVNSAGESVAPVLSRTVTGVDGRTDTPVTTPAGAPVVPTGLNSQGVSGTTAAPRVTLNWVDASNNETAFDVFRATGAAAPVLIGSVTSATTAGTGATVSFVDGVNNTLTTTRPVNGTTYTYTVKSRTNTVSSTTASNAVTVKVGVPSTPTALTGTAVLSANSTDTVTLKWTEEATNSNTSYVVQYSATVLLGMRTWTTVAFVPAAGPNATTGTVTVNNNIRNNTAAQFRIAATNALGTSAYTAGASVTLP